ncbi:MAG TPA: exopolyphosphatase, partial [Planctomycetota bacterium]|nr:exopolyphosphatase [Planctomycetota bacterium]
MRLVTRPDLDGLTCAVILSECEAIDAVELVHPQDVSERRVAIGPDDILANVPYHPDCGMWFDNHLLTDPKAMPPTGFKGRYGKAPSAARLVYEHYLASHPRIARHERLLAETDRLDSAQLTIEDVVSPSGYVLLGFTL